MMVIRLLFSLTLGPAGERDNVSYRAPESREGDRKVHTLQRIHIF